MNRLNPCIILANKMAIPLAFSMFLVPAPDIESHNAYLCIWDTY